MADVKQAKRSSDQRRNGGGTQSGGKEQFGEELQHLVSALADRVLSGANDKVGGLTDKLSGLGDGNGTGKAVAKAGEKVAEGKSPLRAGLAAAGESVKSTVSKAVGGGGKGGGGKKVKLTNIIEEIDIGAPISLVYDQWTQFQEFSNFMKKVEGVDQKDEQKLEFKAQVLWSHRTWQATILEQVPDERIVWRSSGAKGHVDGAVTFHELAPDLTRVLVVLEYHPQGLFERTGNLWRAQGRRVRLELKHFRRHVMTHTLLHPDDVEGWRGEIHDSKVTKSNEDARAEQDESDEDEYGEDDDELTDEAEESDEDEADEEEADEDDESDEDADDEYDEDDELEDEVDEDDELEDEDDEDDESEDEADEDDEDDEDDELEDEADEDDEPADEDEQDEIAQRRGRRRAGGGSRRPARAAQGGSR